MIPSTPMRLSLRFRKDTFSPQHLQPNIIALRQYSTSPTDSLEPSDTHKLPPRSTFSSAIWQLTPQEIAYKARVKAGGKKVRPFQMDMYTQKLIDARRAVIKSRQQIGRKREDENTADNPIHGSSETTPFVQSLGLGMPLEKVFIPNEDGVPSRPPAVVDTGLKDQDEILSSENTGVAKPDHLAHFLSSEELDRFGKISAALSKPVISDNRAAVDPQAELKQKSQHEEDHATRMAALARIMAVENLGSRDRSQVNTRRIIDEFGRHRTDKTIDPRQNIRRPHHDESWTSKQRIGPDTGSSEVQIALLTAKIKILAGAYEAGHKHDKANKRNLRLLLHRRQKLLAYFYKKDRGGERWQHMVEKLGVTPAMWEGEIEVR